MKTLEQFLNEITTNKELTQMLIRTTNEQEIEKILKENGVNGTAEEFKALLKEKMQGGCELSDEELIQASGGLDSTPDGGEWAGNGVVYDINKLVFEFNVGETVFVWDQHIDQIGTILEKKISQDYDFAYPLYYVRLKNGPAKWYGQSSLAHINDMSVINLLGL